MADGIALHISGEHFDYRGYFGRPAPLAAGAAFVRHPIPQEVWEAATQTVAGGSLTVELTLAKGGKAYGPITRALDDRQRPAQGHGLLPELRHQPGQEPRRRDGRRRQVRRRDARDQAGRDSGPSWSRARTATNSSAASVTACQQRRQPHDGAARRRLRGDQSYDLRNGYKEMAYPTRARQPARRGSA